MQDDLKERLRAWSPLVASGYEAPAASLVMDEAADRIEALEAEVERLREALGLADAALRGANMNMNVVERKLRAALEAKHG